MMNTEPKYIAHALKCDYDLEVAATPVDVQPLDPKLLDELREAIKGKALVFGGNPAFGEIEDIE